MTLSHTHTLSLSVSLAHTLTLSLSLSLSRLTQPHTHTYTQAVIPGGVSVPMLTAEMCEDALMDFDGLRVYKSALGTGSMTVLDKSQDPIAVVARIASFFK